MNKFAYFSVLALMFVLPIVGQAQVTDFQVSLGVGVINQVEVLKLQQFLFDQGYLKVTPTGNYLSLTKAAVQAFQASQNIEQTGYFGPKSRMAANSIVSAKNNVAKVPPAQVSDVSVSKMSNQTAAVFSGEVQGVMWQTTNYPTGVGVNINLLRKVSDVPAEYMLVRQIAKDTLNDGVHTWSKIVTDGNVNDLYVEVTCSTTYAFKGECRFTGQAIKVF